MLGLCLFRFLTPFIDGYKMIVPMHVLAVLVLLVFLPEDTTAVVVVGSFVGAAPQKMYLSLFLSFFLSLSFRHNALLVANSSFFLLLKNVTDHTLAVCSSQFSCSS